MQNVILEKKMDQWWSLSISVRLIRVVKLWMARHQQRKQLARLSDEQLRDIGISHQQRWQEIRKPFWR